MICEICNAECKNIKALVTHIVAKHPEFSTKKYYDLYFKKEGDGVCLCGADTKYINFSNGYSPTCSRKCSIKLTIKQKYGVDNISQIKGISDKVKQTKLERYGSESYNNSLKQQSTINENRTEFYEKRSNKTKTTCLTKYGVDNVFKSEQVKNKQKQTMLTKYNVEHNSLLQETIERRSKTFFNKYWETFVLILKNKKIDVCFSKDDYCSYDGIYEFKCNNCNSIFSRSIESKYKLRPQNIYCGCQSKGTSVKEKQLFDLISYENKIPNNRFSKDGKIYELDIYLPEINLGIEFNGLYWHSEVYKDSDYHKNKSDWFKLNYGIDIIHVFENDFDNKLDIVLSIINNRIGNNLIKIPARKCIKKEISSKEYKDFLDNNHIQGSINSKIKLGLFYNNELVSVIGIGKSRFDKTDELHRYCNKLNYSIIGGFSKLMKGITNLTTYCDMNYFNGNGYRKIGFIEEYQTKPNYKYFKNSTILSRYQCQKHKLKLILDKFDPALTEHENMLNNGWIRIYDCGNIKLKI